VLPRRVPAGLQPPGVHLIDTDGKGVERITETGVVVAGVEYEVDCIIYASGFEVGTDHTRRAGFDLTGRDGRTLSEHWADGMRTKHGIHVHGFPNAFVWARPGRQPDLQRAPQPHRGRPHHRRRSSIRHALDVGRRTEVEVTAEAEDAWIELLARRAWAALAQPRLHARLLQQRGPASSTSSDADTASVQVSTWLRPRRSEVAKGMKKIPSSITVAIFARRDIGSSHIAAHGTTSRVTSR
jgi:hypothetical protein